MRGQDGVLWKAFHFIGITFFQNISVTIIQKNTLKLKTKA
jgi:hypothetical protein